MEMNKIQVKNNVFQNKKNPKILFYNTYRHQNNILRLNQKNLIRSL
jgi:hypothetical protein